MLSGTAAAQSKPGGRIKPITVCDVLANLKEYNGKTVAVVGRLDEVNGLFDGRAFLAEDRCEHPLVTEGYVWPNRILIWRYWEEPLPKPPNDNPEVDRSTLLQKLSLVKKTTELHVHKVRLPKSYGVTTQNEWDIAYGIIYSADTLKKGCTDKFGCGGFFGAPVVIVEGPNSVRNVKDEQRRNTKFSK